MNSVDELVSIEHVKIGSKRFHSVTIKYKTSTEYSIGLMIVMIGYTRTSNSVLSNTGPQLTIQTEFLLSEAQYSKFKLLYDNKFTG